MSSTRSVGILLRAVVYSGRTRYSKSELNIRHSLSFRLGLFTAFFCPKLRLLQRAIREFTIKGKIFQQVACIGTTMRKRWQPLYPDAHSSNCYFIAEINTSRSRESV